jgi:hypothetical protein
MRGCYHDIFRACRRHVAEGRETPTTRTAAAALGDERRKLGAKNDLSEIVREERPVGPANPVKWNRHACRDLMTDAYRRRSSTDESTERIDRTGKTERSIERIDRTCKARRQDRRIQSNRTHRPTNPPTNPPTARRRTAHRLPSAYVGRERPRCLVYAEPVTHIPRGMYDAQVVRPS